MTLTRLAHKKVQTRRYESAASSSLILVPSTTHHSAAMDDGKRERAGHKADLVAVVGANGHVVSRDLNMNAMYDDDLKSKYPSVGTALVP